ncbi:Hypothetical predicted protein [Paramuricea clavata]|uniref:Uncharacterized protein n=1 Tax=Paramuricea clavata TaxID=317549 RepID=A0A7D9L9F0_PARCT|nr:Hypothetical predicted protein [Paramuricea clavata]
MVDNLFKVKQGYTLPSLPANQSLQCVANDFSEFFSSKTLALRNNLQNSGLPLLLQMSVTIDCVQCDVSFTKFSKVSENYVKNIIKQSKPKSCMLDPAPTNVIKQLVDILAGPLTRIINTSLTSGIFPSSLKKGVILPSFKRLELDFNMYSSYRPITNVAFLSKTLERVVSTQMTSYFIDNHLLAKRQSAYRSFYSTETALLRVFNDVLYAIDDHQEIVLVLLDLSSIFDTIDHTLLLERLSYRYGINGTVFEWFKSYLLDRTQSVKVKDALSNDKKLLFGFPQGSVLGPILFSLFFAPMEDVITAHGLSCMIYADDSQPYVILDPKKNRDSMLSKIELCIKDILIWCAKKVLLVILTRLKFSISRLGLPRIMKYPLR